MEWEPWFTPHNDDWTIGEAVPVLGWYDSFNQLVLEQHCIWFIEAGEDGLVVVVVVCVCWGGGAFPPRRLVARS
jgi:hypothetical protein